MLRLASKYFASVPPVYIDGLLYVIIAICGTIAGIIGSDEAYNLFQSVTLFWIKSINATILAGSTALKMFRSTAYSDHIQKQEDSKTQNPQPT